MKKMFLGILAGLAIGSGATWWLAGRHEEEHPAAEKAAKGAEEEHKDPLRLTPGQRKAAGIVLAEPQAVELPAETTAYGRVLDPASLAAALSEIESARATEAASGREHARLKMLHADDSNASAQAVEAAEAAVRRDRAQLMAAQARMASGWGAALAARSDLGELIGLLLQQKASLARLDVLPGAAIAGTPGKARVGALADGGELHAAEILGPAPSADPQVQGASYLVCLREHPLPAGTVLRARLPAGGPGTGALLVPREALIYHEGSAWVYVLGEKDTFVRHRVELGESGNRSVAIFAGIAAGDRVVTVGAQQLLSSELQASGGAAD